MGGHTLILVFLLAPFKCTHSELQYYVTPSPVIPCPQEPCITLSQFAANSRSYGGTIPLLFLPGHHSLDKALVLSHIGHFSMESQNREQTVVVSCITQTARITINETTIASIKGLHFIGCGGNTVTKVEELTVEDTIFQGVEGDGRGTALVLNEVNFTQIINCSFISNTPGINSERHYVGEYIITNLDLLFANDLEEEDLVSVGGAIFATSSNVSVTKTKFALNEADIGGVLFAYQSIITITHCTYSYNRAYIGGAIVTAEAYFSVANSAHLGGVIAISNVSFSVTSSTFTNNSANFGGVIAISNGSFSVTSSTFTNNTAALRGGVMHISDAPFSVTSSTFTNNSANSGGVIAISNGSFSVFSSTFTNNTAALRGGVMYISDASFSVTSSTFTNNNAINVGGVMYISDASFSVTSSTFTNNNAHSSGVIFAKSFSNTRSTLESTHNTDFSAGVIWDTLDGSFNITNCTFANNAAAQFGGVMFVNIHGSINIISSNFTNSTCSSDYIYLNTPDRSVGGVMHVIKSGSLNISNSIFTNNTAHEGGVVFTLTSFNINNSTFTNNSVKQSGGVINTGASFNITNSTFTSNAAAKQGGVMYCELVEFIMVTSSTFIHNKAGVIYSINGAYVNISDSSFENNAAPWHSNGGIVFTQGGTAHIIDSTFRYNSGSIHTFNSKLTFSGQLKFENCAEPLNKTPDSLTLLEGGALTSFQSTVIFNGESSLLNNQARQGGAILAIESTIVLNGTTTIIANNTATDSSGGGVSLQQSDLDVKGNCTISNNYAMRGGGISARSSTITVYNEEGTLLFKNNNAENGSGLCLEVNAKLYLLKTAQEIYNKSSVIFTGNQANYGGAVYVADDTNSGACLPNTECFIQTLAIYESLLLSLAPSTVTANVQFTGNTATERGPDLYGGLLDRCVPSSFAEVYKQPDLSTQYYNGVKYLKDISNIALDSVSSPPIRVCFCLNESEPDCSYQPSPIKVKKGETFKVSLVAVDQVDRSVEANIISSLASLDGGFSEGQQTQSVGRNCKDNLTFNIYSPSDYESIHFYADGPCANSELSIRKLDIQFLNCTCPVGFQPSNSELTRCVCICDSQLPPEINCNFTTSSIIRKNTNVWITYINDTDQPGYVIHPNCPYDYCQPQTVNVSINLNLPDGADAQCAFNRREILCGACQEHLSLSLGSSRCLPCPTYWPAVFAVLLLAAIIAGVLLVSALLAFNMTVAVGLINGFIFYANIMSANSAVFFPSTEPSFPTVFVAWLNLDLGIDACFIAGLDTYTKTWLQLFFPVYIISLVVIIIIVSEYSPRFAALIGRKDPIATLATLILLSYAKLLSITITVVSPAVIDYPDGSQETVWLPDGNVKYFRGKHAALLIVALLIILVGVPYSITLLLWQWIVRIPTRWKVFNWTRNTKLNAFIAAYQVPYNSKYRYWTGLLLLVRVILYIIASVTVSAHPQASLLATIVLVGGILLFKSIINLKVYKQSITDIVDTIIYFNLLALAAFSLYEFKIDITKQTAVAYTSTIITFLLLLGVIAYHVYLLVMARKEKAKAVNEQNELLLGPVQSANVDATHIALVTYSVVEFPKPPSDLEGDDDEVADVQQSEIIAT